VWCWSNLLNKHARPGGPCIRINFDETNVRLHTTPGKGHLTVEAIRLRRTPLSLTRNVKAGYTKAAATHLMSVCDDAALQKSLPQILILNQSLVSDVVFAELTASLPANVYVYRQPKAWVNGTTMCEYVRLLARHLALLRVGRSVIVYSDAYRSHFSPAVLQAFARHNFMVCLIPAKMTWALQPCDTHVFVEYKRALVRILEEFALCTDSGKITWVLLVSAICRVLTEIVESKPWVKAFLDLGLTGHQRLVSDRCLSKLELRRADVQVSDTFVTLQQLEDIFPKKCIVPAGALFAGLVREQNRTDPEIPERRRPPSPSPVPPKNAWYGRTRSATAAKAQGASTASASTAPAPCQSWAPKAPPPPRLPPYLPNAKRMNKRPSQRALSPQSLPPQ